MRTILGALALGIAAPAFAQVAPAADPHAGHAQHEGQTGVRQEHVEHKMDCCEDCCEKMKHEGRSKEQSGTPDEGAAGADQSQHAH